MYSKLNLGGSSAELTNRHANGGTPRQTRCSAAFPTERHRVPGLRRALRPTTVRERPTSSSGTFASWPVFAAHKRAERTGRYAGGVDLRTGDLSASVNRAVAHIGDLTTPISHRSSALEVPVAAEPIRVQAFNAPSDTGCPPVFGGVGGSESFLPQHRGQRCVGCSDHPGRVGPV